MPTTGFKLLYGIAIFHLKRRELVRTNATLHPTAEWIAQQIAEAFSWDRAPDRIIRDRDASYGAVFKRRLDSLGIRDHPTAPRSPWRSGYVKWVNGSIRRECTDRMIILGESHLRRTLRSYACCYNRARTRLSLAKDSPIHRSVQRHNEIIDADTSVDLMLNTAASASNSVYMPSSFAMICHGTPTEKF